MSTSLLDSGTMRVSERPNNITTPGAYSPDGDVTEMEMLGLMIMLPIFSVVGSVGNGLVIFVFQRVRDKSTAQIFIITMAVIDLFTCMVIIPFTMFVEYSRYYVKYDFLCKFYQFLITSKIPLSALIMVAIAFDRYFCICHPLRRIITVRKARITVICLSVLACFFGVITSLFYGVYQIIERIDHERIDRVMGTNFTASLTHMDDLVVDRRSERWREIRRRLIETLRASNYTFENNDSIPVFTEEVYMGICNPSSVIFGETLFHAYHRVYTAVYPMCLLTVMILYLMIYRFICLRRSKKLQQKLIMCSYVNGETTYENSRLVSGADGEDRRKNSKNKALDSSPINGNFSTPVSGTNGVSPAVVVIRTTSSGNNVSAILSGQEANKHGNNLLMDPCPRSKLSTCSDSAVTAITPSDNDDNTPILSFYNNNTATSNSNNGDRNQLNQLGSARRHSHLPEQKYQWHKNRDSMKRCKGRKRRKSQYSYEADRLREENRSANVKTALMLFTVTVVFIVAFVPAWMMAHRIIPSNRVVFYLYFSYNVANPFIYAFMNHIFKDYMSKMVTCKDLQHTRRRSS